MDPRVAAVDDESVVQQEHLQQEIQQQQRWQQYDWNAFTEFLSIEDPSVTTPQQCSSDHVIRFLITYCKQFANKIFHTAHCQFYDPHRLSPDDPRSCHCPPTHDFSFLQGLVFRLSSAYKKNIGGRHGSNPFMSEEVWRFIQQDGNFQSQLRNNRRNSKKRKTHPSTATTAAADSSAPAQPLAASTEEALGKPYMYKLRKHRGSGNGFMYSYREP